MEYDRSIVEELGESTYDYGLADYVAAGPRGMKRDVWDASELSTEATGGLLPWRVTTWGANGNDTPACLNGHAAFLDGVGALGTRSDHQTTPALRELRRLGIGFSGIPDHAIERVSGNHYIRAPFVKVMEQLNIVRGDS